MAGTASLCLAQLAKKMPVWPDAANIGMIPKGQVPPTQLSALFKSQSSAAAGHGFALLAPEGT